MFTMVKLSNMLMEFGRQSDRVRIFRAVGFYFQDNWLNFTSAFHGQL